MLGKFAYHMQQLLALALQSPAGPDAVSSESAVKCAQPDFVAPPSKSSRAHNASYHDNLLPKTSQL